ncbi:MAG: glycosyltransferase family 4 protein [Polyangiaceae bacterium]|nr:glycosyltransferase family 4 protein [Polyangiaceae bacterium]
MRIAHVATSYPRDPDDPTGHFVRAEALADALENNEVHIVAPAPFARDVGVEAHALGGAALFSWPGAVARGRALPSRWLHAPVALARGARALAELEPDVIVAHWALPCAWPMSAGRRAELRVVSHGGDVRLLVGLPSPARDALVGWLAARAAEWRFVARSLLGALLDVSPPSLRTDVERIASVRPPRVDVSEAGAPPGHGHAVVVGRLVRSKRIDLAIDAATRARVPLVVIGDGPEEGALRRRAAGADVRFTGRLGRRDTLSWLRGARALLHPSELDAAPTAVLEARALSVPVIAADVGDVAWWATRDDGITVTRRDARSLADALAR